MDRWTSTLVASTFMDLAQKLPSNSICGDLFAVERANLLRLAKLVVGKLLQGAVAADRGDESCQSDVEHVRLEHLIVVAEHCLLHGLKQKRTLLPVRNGELWELLQQVVTLCSDALDITDSARQLPTATSSLGKCRAWLRLALMQKRLGDYVQLLLSFPQLLEKFYEPWALMRNDESVHVAGLLIGINTIDCNFCLKEMDMDVQCSVVDLGMYLRSSVPSEESHTSIDGDTVHSDYHALAEQKNYIEELNRKLNTTVISLRCKLENKLHECHKLRSKLHSIIEGSTINVIDGALVDKCPKHNAIIDTTSNQITSVLEEADSSDLPTDITVSSISNRISSDTGDDIRVSAGDDPSPPSHHQQLDTSVADDPSPSSHHQQSGTSAGDDPSPPSQQFGTSSGDDEVLINCVKQLQQTNDQLKHQLESKTQLLEERESAVCQLERDIHDKQDTIASIRRQLTDVKHINLQMYNKLQECEKTLKSRNSTISSLQEKILEENSAANKVKDLLSACNNRLNEKSSEVNSLRDSLTSASVENTKFSADLKMEREWRESLQSGAMEDRDKINSLTTQLESADKQLHDQEKLLVEMERLRVRCSDYETTMEELGQNLSESKLKMEDLRDTAKSVLDFHWVPDELVTKCAKCQLPFSISRRKHHCRNCGHVYCSTCSDNTTSLASSAKPVRVCDDCHTFLLRRHQTTL